MTLTARVIAFLWDHGYQRLGWLLCDAYIRYEVTRGIKRYAMHCAMYRNTDTDT